MAFVTPTTLMPNIQGFRKEGMEEKPETRGRDLHVCCRMKFTERGTHVSVTSSCPKGGDPLGRLGAWTGLMDLFLAQTRETSVTDGPFHGAKSVSICDVHFLILP